MKIEKWGIPVPILIPSSLDQKWMPCVFPTPTHLVWSFPVMPSNAGVGRSSCQLTHCTVDDLGVDLQFS